jgi:hypothetical protein
VNRLSERDVAERVGVEVEYVRRLAGIGVLDPTEDGAFSEGGVLAPGSTRASNGRVSRSMG